MKKRLLVLSSMALTMVVLASCYMPAPTASVGDSQTQVALFAQATLTKFAQQMTETQPPTSQDTVVPATATLAPPTATNVPPTAVPPTLRLRLFQL